MAEDLNPDFTFHVETDSQMPWEFAEAQVLNSTGNQTSIDHKIQQRLLAKGPKKHAKGKASKQRQGAEASSEDEASSDDDGEAGDSSDEDAVLPGEEDEEDSNDTSVVFSEEESDDEERNPGVLGRHEKNAKERLDRLVGVANVTPGQQRTERATGSKDANEDTEEDLEGDEDEEEHTGTGVAERCMSGQEAGPSGEGHGYFAQTPKGTQFSAPSFGDLNLSRPLVKACTALGYQKPTPIQAACIPLALMGRDISGSAMTGSGKTAAFALPILERLLFRSRRVATTYALILTPTRELAVQVHSMVQKLAQFTDVRAALVVGGLSLQVQAATLRSSPEIIVATPGRLIDHLRNTQSVGLEDLQALVLDEADRLLEMGFSEEIKQVLQLTPRKRQTMLFSATMTEEVQKLAALSLQRPIRLAADPRAAAPKLLTQEVVRIKGKDAGAKEAFLLALCSRGFKERTIIFFRTKKGAHRAKMLFGLAGLPPAAELHGDMTQAMRLESLERFRKGEVAFLLATDVAARGLDILGVEVVVNYNAPPTLASYLHRIGRTARAGKAGKSVTFVEDEDRRLIKEVVKRQKFQLQERVVPAASVRSWAARIERLTPDIERLVQEEREERELRRAELQVAKAENMIQHEAEIFSRPARTWFQTTREKLQLAKAEKEGTQQAPQKGARDKQAERNAKKRARAADAERDLVGKKKHKLMQDTEAASRNIRAIKSREAELRQQGMAPVKAGRAAAAQVTGKSASTKQQKKAGKQGKESASLFEGTGTGREEGRSPGKTKVYAGGQKSQKFRPPKGLSTQERNKMKRHGKGARAFKSKAKHKRR